MSVLDEHEVVLRGGRAVLPTGVTRVDIGVRGGRIAQIGGPMRGQHEWDVSSDWVLPGGVDPHVHLTCADATPEDPGWIDDFESGTRAALAGGITTVGNMSFVLPTEKLFDRLDLESADARRLAIADVFLHPVVLAPVPETIEAIPRLAAAGFPSVKIFMTFPTFAPSAGQFALLMRAAAASGMMTLIHCEDFATIECCTALLRADARNSLEHFHESRPTAAEAVATERAIAMCEATGCPVYIVHLSSRRALDACIAARARGLPVFVETRPLYLFLTDTHYQGPDAPLFVAQPPLRREADVEALWDGLLNGHIDTIGSDHAPWSRAQKLDPHHNLSNLRPGVAELDTMLPLLFTHGVLAGRLTVERFVSLTSTRAAQLFGLYPQKGAIAVGSDADLVVWREGETRQVTAARLFSRAGHSVYEGWTYRAWPHLTFRRGELVHQDGVALGRPGSGILPGRVANRTRG
jgi:dihydropyrimidinase